jgi:hypothetical protein
MRKRAKVQMKTGIFSSLCIISSKISGAVIVPNLTRQQLGLSAFTPPLSPRTNLQRGNRCNPAALRLLNLHRQTDFKPNRWLAAT